MELYEYPWTENIVSDETIQKFLKVFDYWDDTYAYIDNNIWFIDFADMYIWEDFLDKCLKKWLKNDKAIDYYWLELDKYEKKQKKIKKV